MADYNSEYRLRITETTSTKLPNRLKIAANDSKSKNKFMAGLIVFSLDGAL